MSKRKTNGYSEERQRKCMLALVRDILSDKSVVQISYETVHGAITVTRNVPERKSIYAIGFTANFEREDEEDEE